MFNVLKSIIAISVVAPSLAFAASAKEELANKMKAAASTSGGVSVQMVSPSLVEKVIAKSSGNVTVDLGIQGQMLRSGGVIVGSGADGLAASTNVERSGNVVVHPPIEPSTSITVVGTVLAPQNRPTGSDGSTKYDVCAAEVKYDAQGAVLPGQSKYNNCAELGTPLRLKAGKFILNALGTYAIVDLKQGEKKVIPLRQITVPKANDKVEFWLSSDIASAKVVRIQATVHFATTEMWIQTRKTDSPTKNDLRKATSIEDLIRNVGMWVDARPPRFPRTFVSYNESSRYKGNVTLSVLPGDYVFTWKINDQDVDQETRITVN